MPLPVPFCPAIRRTGEPELALQLPLLPWGLRSGGIGGSAVSAAGVPESYEVRTDRIAMVVLRMLEVEVEDVLLTLEAIRRSSESFTFLFDQADDYTAHEVYLEAPVWPDEITPARSDFPGVFTLPIELRSVSGVGFTLPWLED